MRLTGCLLGDVDRETQLSGLAAVLGFISLTGIAGLTVGGGFGYLTRRWVEPALCEKVIEHAARITSPHSAVILFQIEGALNRLNEDHSPVGNRDARYVLNLAGSWERADEDEANVAWARGVERHEGFFDRWHLRQFSDRGRISRTHQGSSRKGVAPARSGQGEVGPGQFVPDQS